MNYVFYDYVLDRQRCMARIVKEFLSRVFLRRDESGVYRYDPDGLGVWVGVHAGNPEVVLKNIHRISFPTFEFSGTRTDQNGLCWTHFRLC